MWVAKFQVSRKSSIFEPIAKKHNITVIGYPITSFRKNNKYYFIGAGTFVGSEKNIEKCLIELKRNKKVKKVELHGSNSRTEGNGVELLLRL